MSEEIKKDTAESTAASEVTENASATTAPNETPVPEATAPADTTAPSAGPETVTESAETKESAPTVAEEATAPADDSATATTQPQVIIERERDFAHYVGFALLCVLSIIFFFVPGIAVTYTVNLIPGVSLGAIAAWIFSALLSVIIWFIFKLKIKGFKKSFYFYIGLCVVVLAILGTAEALTDSTKVFTSIFHLLTGTQAVPPPTV